MTARVPGHCTRAGAPPRGGSCGFAEQTCCAAAARIGLTSAKDEPRDAWRTQRIISDYRQRVRRDPDRGRWPTSAVVIVVLSFALVTVVVSGQRDNSHGVGRSI